MSRTLLRGASPVLRINEQRERVERLIWMNATNDDGYGLKYEDEEDMIQTLTEVVAALDSSNTHGTITNEASNFKHWYNFCAARETKLYRKRPWVKGDDVYNHEVAILVEALLYIYKHMQKRKGWSTCCWGTPASAGPWPCPGVGSEARLGVDRALRIPMLIMLDMGKARLGQRVLRPGT